MKYQTCQCVDCKQNIEFPLELCGQVISCPSCNRQLILPNLEVPTHQGFLGRLVGKFKEAKQRSANKKELKSTLLSLVSDGILTSEERQALERRESDLGLSSTDVRDWGMEVFEVAFRRAKRNGHLSAESESALAEIQHYLELRDSDVAETKTEICRSRRLYEIQHDNMPPIEVSNVILNCGESAYWSESGTLYEEKVVSRRYEGGSTGVSFRVMKGVSFRVGNHRGHVVSETGSVPVSHGRLIVTNQRLIFQGDRKSFTARFEKIIEVQPAIDGIRFSEANCQKPRAVLYDNHNGEFVCEVLSRLMSKSIAESS